MGMVGDTYSPIAGLKVLDTYAGLYGLTDTSGVEIEESMPQTATGDAVRASIGQDNNSFSTVGLARYVTTVANSGTCYDLTLVDKITDHRGQLLQDNQAKVRNIIEMDSANWDAIHLGMRQMVENNTYLKDLPIGVAGKTGTAEENKNRANHALFVCYAPYDQPEIAIATRIAFGYSSSYAARTTKEIIQYYFGLVDEEDLLNGIAEQMAGSTAIAD